MAIDNYPKAYKEVLTILENIPEKDLKKIPENMIEVFKLNQDKNYDYEIDINKPFEEQEMLDETKAIFANIFRDYWATQEQREKILAKENYDRAKAEEEIRDKYNPDNLFKDRNKKDSETDNIAENHKVGESKTNQSNLPMETKKQNFFARLIGFIKGLFRHYDKE